jgi:drug/metabolite transporter (DMT)-like permease
MNRTLSAIGFMLASMLCFSAMNTIIRHLATDLHSTQMVFMRNVLSLLIIIAIAAVMQRGRPRFPTERLSGHIWRGTIGLLSMELWFHAITLMELTLATAISFITPILSTIIAILFLGEKAGIRRWGAIIAGFIGMLVILRPDASGMNPNVVFVLVSSTLMAIAGTVVKSLTRTEPPETIVFYMSLIMTLWSIVPAALYWRDFTLVHVGWAFLIALFSTGAHLMLARAYMRADVVVLMPFDFTRLIFTAILAYLFFAEIMDSQTIIGSLIIVASTVYIAHREARLNRKKPSDTIAS